MNPYYIPDTPVFAFNGKKYSVSSDFHKLNILYGQHLLVEALDTRFETPDNCDIAELEKYCELEESKFF
jgi:hypothetical protein